MKKLLLALLCFVLLFGVNACGSSTHTPSEERERTESESAAETGTTERTSVVETETTAATEAKIAVVCFSGAGNTMAAAETIVDVAEWFRIKPI